VSTSLGAGAALPPAEPAGRLRFWGALVCVAVLAALFAILFRAALSFLYRTCYGAQDILHAFQHLTWEWRIAVVTLGGFLAGVVARVAARDPAAQGVGDVMEAVVFGRVTLSLRASLLKALGSFAAIVTGGSVGREGPLIQFGGALGGAVARTASIGGEQARVLVAAGVAAGFGAAYNTPFAAVLFVLEVVTGVIVLDALLPAMVATAIATTLTRALVGGGPIYGERAFTLTGVGQLASLAVLGLAAAVLARGFMGLLAGGERLWAWSRLPQPWRAAVGALAVGLAAAVLPEVTGNGSEPLNLLLDGALSAGLILVLVPAKMLATTASVTSGSPGGVFTPSLLLGGALGAAFFHLVSALGLGGGGTAGSYALVGMAAMTAATTFAPLMAAVMVFELSGDYAIVLPLLLATALATWLSRSLGRDSVYTAELRRRGVSWEVGFDGLRSGRD
jgi:chloride channel protein, CIC family